jgi:transcriptional regulator with XRE-family HTH domain
MSRLPPTDWTLALAKVMAASKHLRTQTALARKTGVAQSTIGRIVRKEVDPQVGNLERIASAFGLPLAKLAEMGQQGEPVIELPDVESPERSTAVVVASWVEGSMQEDIERAFLQALNAREDRKRAQVTLGTLRRKEEEAIEHLHKLVLERERGAPP